MKEAMKSAEELSVELADMRQQVADLEAALVERKRKVESLQESEARYRELFNNMSSGVAVYEVREDGRDFMFKDFNKAGERIDSQAKEELIGKSIFEMRPGIEQFGLLEVFREVWETGTPMHHPVKQYKDGRLSGWYENFVYKLPSGEIVAIFDDISAQKQSEEALRKGEEKFRSYIENAPNGIFVTDEHGNYLEVNQAAEQITGYSQRELLNMNLIDLIPGDNRAQAEEHFHAVVTTGKACGELAFTKKDGSRRYWRVDAVKLSEDRFLGFVADITEGIHAEKALRESEERWQFALEGSGDGVWDWDAQANQVFFSHQWKAMLGYEDHEIGNTLEEWDKRLHPDDHDAVYAELQKHFAGQSSLYTSEHRLQCKDGSYKWILDRGKVIRWAEDHTPLRVIGTHTDISDRKRAEEALRSKQAFLDRIIEQSPFAMWISDPEGTMLRANPALKRFLNLTDEQLIGKYNVFLDPFSERQGLLPQIRTVYEEGKSIHFTCDWDGNDIPTMDLHGSNSVSIEATMFPIHNAEGELTHVVLSWIDISERKQAEEALKESEERYRTLARNFPNGAVVLFDRDLRYLVAEGTGLAESQLSSSDMEGKTIWEVFPPETCQMIEADYRAALAGERCRKEVPFAEHTYMTHTLPVLDDHGCIIAGMVMTQDITERKQMEKALRENEEKLKTLFGAMTEMVVLHEVVYDERGDVVNYRITDCNPTFTAVTGIPREAAIGRLATEVYQAEKAPYLEEFSAVAQTGEPYEFTEYYPPMDKHFMISVVSPQQGAFATITTDITALKQIQNVIFAKNKELENYLYVASHDLRAPLVNIQGFSQRLQKQVHAIKTLLADHSFDESEKQQKLEQLTEKGIPKSLEFIFTNVSKMDTLINGLLKISRTGRVKMSIQKVNMTALFEKIVQAFSFQIDEAGGKIVFEALQDCYGDLALLDQLFSNLIGNALKYRDPSRQFLVTISAQVQYKKVLYCVRDTGLGIAPRHLEKIWDVFYQVDSQSPEAGEGIGLSIVKRIVDKHKGKIWVESEENKGSVFYVELPGDDFSE